MAGLDWDQYRYRVTGAEMVTPVIRELRLSPHGPPLPYRPGQYALLGDAEFRVPQRSYSVAGAPRPDGCLTLLVTRVDGGATSTWAHRLRPGDDVLLEGPFGSFVSAPDRAGPVLLLGAGSGLAPVRALAEDLLARQPHRPVTLCFSGRTAADAIDRDRFEAWQRGRPGFRYVLTLTRDARAPRHQRIPALLAGLVENLQGWEVFAAGPPGFVAGCATAARDLGAAPVDVHTEEFFADPQPWTGAEPPAPARPDVASAAP